MNRRLKRTQIESILSLAAHPGIARANLALGMEFVGTLLSPKVLLFLQSALMGAIPILRAAADAQRSRYYGPDKPHGPNGFLVIVS